MKKINKKGFTIVELVIVIAVIAILAGVLIPTFSGVIKKANMSNVQQVAASLYKEIYALDLADGEIDGLMDGYPTAPADNTYTVEGKAVIYKVSGKNVTEFVYTTDSYTVTFDGSKWTTTQSDT